MRLYISLVVTKAKALHTPNLHFLFVGWQHKMTNTLRVQDHQKSSSFIFSNTTVEEM